MFNLFLAVIIDKIRLFKKINQSTEEFETKFWNSKSAETFYNNLPSNIEDPMALVFKDAMQNLLKKRSKTDLHDRMTTMLETGIEKQMSKISKGYTFLATVGSTAPFIGLFGHLGNNELISIDCNIKKYKFGNCCSWYCRSIICYSIRAFGSNPSCYCVQ